MKLLKIALLAAAIAAPAMMNAQVAPPVGGPGIAIAGTVDYSALPKAAGEFIAKYYPGQGVMRLEKNFLRTEYDVRLVNGVEIEFTGKGKVASIEAPGNTVLPEEVVKAILPAKAYKHLKDSNLVLYVDEISVDRRGYDVGLIVNNPDEVVYSIEGEFVAFDD